MGSGDHEYQEFDIDYSLRDWPHLTTEREILEYFIIKDKKLMRTFETGATRNSDTEKYDYEGFLSPTALGRFAAYMHKHRQQADGKLRASDNWQKGIPQDEYLKSAWRHFKAWWTLHRAGLNVGDVDNEKDVDIEEALCGLIFNAFGYLHVELEAKGRNT